MDPYQNLSHPPSFVVVELNSCLFELVDAEGSMDSLSQTYRIMSKFKYWKIKIKMRDLKAIPPHLPDNNKFTPEGKLTITHCRKVENDELKYRFKDSKIVKFKVSEKEPWGKGTFDLTLEEETEELKLLKKEILEKNETSKKTEEPKSEDYGRWDYKKEWDEVEEHSKHKMHNSLEDITFDLFPEYKFEEFRIKITPDKMIIPECGFLDVTLEPKTDFGDALQFIQINLNSGFFELVNANGSKESVSQIYGFMSRFDTWKIRIQMRDFKKVPPPLLLRVCPTRGNLTKPTPNGLFWISQISLKNNQDRYVYPNSNLIEIQNEDLQRTETEFEMKFEKETEDIKKLNKFMEIAIEEYNKSTGKMKWDSKECKEKKAELEKKLEMEKEKKMEEQKLKEQKEKEEIEKQEKDKVLNAQLKTAIPLLRSEMDTMKLLKVTPEELKQAQMRKVRAPHPACKNGRRKKWKKMTSCCVVM